MGKIQQFIDQGRLVIPPAVEHTIKGVTKVIPYQITMRDLKLAGVISQIKDGVKILANVRTLLALPYTYSIMAIQNLLLLC